MATPGWYVADTGLGGIGGVVLRRDDGVLARWRFLAPLLAVARRATQRSRGCGAGAVAEAQVPDAGSHLAAVRRNHRMGVCRRPGESQSPRRRRSPRGRR